VCQTFIYPVQSIAIDSQPGAAAEENDQMCSCTPSVTDPLKTTDVL